VPALRIEGADQLRALSVKLATADVPIKTELRRSLRAVAVPVLAEVKATALQGTGSALGGETSSTGSSASAARSAHSLSRSKSKNRVRAAAKAEANSGLRQTIAAANMVSVSTAKTGVNVTFKMRSSALPPDQRKLGRKWNQGKGWRHPVFGNTNVWVAQVGKPYFDKVIRKNTDVLAGGARAAMQAAAESILHE
jgi:hypothetical protein